jgi:hypothetical protein
MVPGIFQVYDPSLGVDETIKELYAPPLKSCISTLFEKLSVQLIICDVPGCQFSPPFGDVTVTWFPTITKFEFEKSKISESSTLVIFTL